MIPEQELTVILSFYHSPTYQPSNNNKSQEEEEITKSVENKESVEKNMDNSYLTSSLKSTSTAVLTFHDFDNNSSKETKKSAPKLPLNPPPLIDTGVKSNFKLLREAFEQENIIKNQERKKLETKKMSSSAKLVQEAKISEKRWSSHPERIVEGTPPKPEDNPSTKQGGEVRTAVTGITPFYKSDIEQTKAEVRYGSSHNLQYQSGDYKVKESQEHNRMTIIDPKVNSNSNIPASQIFQQKTLVGDFPSQHTKRSFMNLDPLEQKRFKSLERRPVTTTNYLQESVERHREMEASKLKEYLKTNEKDANKPWDKPDWPGPKQDHSESLRELEQMKHAIETLQKQVSEAPKKDDLDELSKLNENLIERSKGLKKDFKLVSSEIIKTDPEPVPDMYKEQLREMLESRISTETAPSPLTLNAAVDRSGYVTDASSTNWQFNNSFSPRSIVSINGGTTKDYHPTILKVRTNNIEKRYNRSNSSVTNSLLTTTETEPIVREFTETYSRIKVRNNNESSNIRQGNERIESIRREPVNIIKESLSSPTDDKPRGIIKPVVTKPRITETIKRIEETRRTEEVERRVQRKEKKHRSHRYHHDDHYMTENHYSGDNLEERRKVLSAEEEDEIRNEAKKLKTLHRSSSMRDKKITNYYHKRRRYTSEEFNDAVKSAYEGVNEAYYDYSHRSSSMNRNGMLPIGYYPGYENYNRTSTTRRDYDNGYYDSSHHHMNGDINQQGRYGSSLSDSLRRGDVKYNPNGEIRESYTYGSRGHRRNSNAGYGMHKSYSTRDIIRDSNGGYYGSYFRNPPNQPFVEFPPTLPRRHGEPPIPPPHRSASQMGIESQYRPISKSHSYADWNDQRNQSGNYSYGRKHDEEMSRLENEFRDSLLVPLNNGKGNINDYEHRVEQIPGGFEEYSRSVKGNSGRRLNRDGIPTDFREQSHSYSFHREQTH